MIENLIKNCLGLSSDLDKTMTMLSSAIEDSDKARLLVVVEELRDKISFMHRQMKEMQLSYENRNVTSEKIEKYRRSIRDAFLKSPQASYWYERTLTESFFEAIEWPLLRVAIIKEVEFQAKARHENFVIPELWSKLIATKGLMNKE